MIRWAALAGSVCAACLEAPPGGKAPVPDGAPGATDAAAGGVDAGPCPVDFRDDFDRDAIGDGWVFYGDSASVAERIDDGAFSIETTAEAVYSFGGYHTELAWTLADHTIEAHVTPEPSADGDVFFGWIEEEGNRYTGMAAVNDSYVANIQGTLSGEWIEGCAPTCPPFEPVPQRWRIRPDGETIVFEVANGSEWKVLDNTLEPQFASGYLALWAETDVGLTSTQTASVVTVASCP